MKRFQNPYLFSSDGLVGYGVTSTGETFIFDAEDYDKIKGFTWYKCNRSTNAGMYVGNRDGICIQRYILDAPSTMEIDHINLNPLDNRKINLRVCTHQQNQCNQPLQQNNTSGITGISYYHPRGKYRARIKIGQHDIHLGYFPTFIIAVQARNVGMECMFGEYGRYNDVPEAPDEVRTSVINKCKRFAELSVCKAFFDGSKTRLESSVSSTQETAE